MELLTTQEQKILIINLKQEGKGYRKISSETGLNLNTIAKFFQRKTRTNKAKKILICPICGKAFKPISGPTAKKFCSKECKYKWWNTDVTKKKSMYTLKCQRCGKPFSSINKKAKFCSRECFFNERFGK